MLTQKKFLQKDVEKNSGFYEDVMVRVLYIEELNTLNPTLIDEAIIKFLALIKRICIWNPDSI